MARSQVRALKAAKEARGGGQFLPLPVTVLRSQALAKLSAIAAKLLLDIASQWHLGRNGDASTAFEHVMRGRGWKSKTTLYKALKELRESGLIVQTRQGSLHQCSLYALGWLAIDDCGGKLDVHATATPLNRWQDPIAPIKNKSSSPSSVPKRAKKADLGTAGVPDG